ncbi:hypothetical protein HLB09_14910, partial [Pseudokineococcus marinus]
MPRTTTRRAATTGLGALAATTALALAAPSALAASDPYVLDPGQDVIFTASGFPVDEDQYETLDATPVDLASDGTVTVQLPERSVPVAPVAELVEAEKYWDALDAGVPPEAVALAQPLVPAVDDGGLLTVVLPGDDAALADVDDAVLLLSGFAVEGFPDSPPLEVDVPLDLVPTEDAADLVSVPAQVDASYLDATAALETPYAATAGETFEVLLPETSTLRRLGVDSLEELDGFLVPMDEEGDGVDLVLDSVFSASSADAGSGADGFLGVVGARAVAELAGDVAEGAAGEESAETGATLDVAEQDFTDEGSVATVRASDHLDEGSYYMVLFLSSADYTVTVTTVGQLDVEAPAPAPTPTVTVTQPGPTATVTTAPVQQNPGLRSNTGVEGGGPSTGLLAAGAGLLALAAA